MALFQSVSKVYVFRLLLKPTFANLFDIELKFPDETHW